MSREKHIQTGPAERFLHLLLIALLILMTLKGGAGSSGACAACKYQRRRCAANCPLAPYFPAEQPKLFQNVHRLFGVRSIVKILENLDETQKPDAMKSIIFQSFVRDRSPVHGCLGLTRHLQYLIWLAEEELKVVNSQLQLYRSQNNCQNQMIHDINGDQKQQEDLDLGMGLSTTFNNHHQSNVHVTQFFSPLPVSETQQPQMSYTTYNSSEANNNGYSPSTGYNTDSWSGQNRFLGKCSNQNQSINSGVTAIQSQLVNLQMVSNQQQQEEQEEEDVHEYDEIHQFLEIIDDRQSFADSKDAFLLSSGESCKEQLHTTGEHELRSAATCFSLT